MSEKVAVVTGANKGIGLGIVTGLCKRFKGTVYLTSRDNKRGIAAWTQLKKDGLNPEYYQLDVADRESVEAFRDYIKSKHGGIDVLVNNAAIASTDNINEIEYNQDKNIIDINYKSLLIIEDLLFPMLRNKARVVNISSDCGHLSNIRNKAWIKRFTKEFTTEDINEFVDWYLDSVKNGTYNRDDLADGSTVAAYRVSKVAMSAWTIVQQKKLIDRGISINSMHPGLVRTDMTQGVGFYSIDQAANTPLYLILEAPQDLRGQYLWYDGKVLDWYNYKAAYYFKSQTLAG